jgi:hypothetical protein
MDELTLMDKETFVAHFKLLLIKLHDHTANLCYNALSKNYTFILEPCGRVADAHLTPNELIYLAAFNKVKDKELLFDDVISLLYKNGTTTKWADCTIYRASSKKTVVKILFAREFADASQIYYLDMGTGPFKAMVALPQDHLKIVKNNKFDVNWEVKRDNAKEGISGRFKNFWL